MSDKENNIKARNERYDKYVKAVTPTTSPFKSLLNSFWIGGLTCVIGEGLADLYALIFPQLSVDMVVNITSMTLITLAILFTGLGFYDVIARRGGAGSFKTEGLIFGTSVKMFTVVGPVVVNGIVWSTVAGLAHLLIFGRFGA